MVKKGLNNALIRIENRKNIAKYLLLHGKRTQQELSRELSMSLPTIILLVSQLEELDLINREKSTEYSSGGRMPNDLCFNYDAYYGVGVEISQSKIELLIINLGNRIIANKEVRVTFSNDADYWQALRDQIGLIITETALPRKKILGVGIAMPGAVNTAKKLIELAPSLKLKEFEYRFFEELIDMPYTVENEAHAACIAEVRVREHVTNATYLSITKGVGGAMYQNGMLVNGRNSRSGGFGHMIMVVGGKKCSCGKKGCFEAYCSTRVLSAYTQSDLDLFFRQLPDNALLQRVWQEYLNHMAVGISNIIVATDQPLILGGSISEGIRPYFEHLSNMVNDLIPFKIKHPMLSLSHVGKVASAMGSAIMILDERLNELLDAQVVG